VVKWVGSGGKDGTWKVKDDGSKLGLGKVGYAIADVSGAVNMLEASPKITWG